MALAEMALAGGLGATLSLAGRARDDEAADDFALLFSESPTRFLLEVRPGMPPRSSVGLSGLPIGRLGR